MKKWIYLIAPLLLFYLTTHAGETHPKKWDTVIKTADGHALRCTYYQPKNEKLNIDARAVILVHMLGGKKKDWHKLPTKLSESGFNVLVLELRGHNSRLPDNKKWTTYERKEFNDMVSDITAARKWLKNERKVHVKKIALVGAQMGANLCLKAMKDDKELLAAYCLSPGANYRGVKVDYKLDGIKDRPLMFVTSEEDTYGAPCLKKFKEESGVTTEILKRDNDDKKGIGTDLLKRKGIQDKIVSWLQKNF